MTCPNMISSHHMMTSRRVMTLIFYVAARTLKAVGPDRTLVFWYICRAFVRMRNFLRAVPIQTLS